MGPRLTNTRGMAAIARLEALGAEPRAVRLYDGGLPQQPHPPWGYDLFFDIEGLTNEYDGYGLVLRGGQVTEVEALTEPELVEFDELGTLEAFVTAGGTSTVPYTLEGRLDVYENKTLRYPGHLAAFRAFKDLGLFSRDPVEVDGSLITPRDLYHRLLEPQLRAERIEDVAVMRAIGTGLLDGREVAVVFEIIDRFDPATGFSAMERLTGWHAAIMVGFIIAGDVPVGVHPVERTVPALRFLDEVRRRGIEVRERRAGETDY
jgi:lysine 6-dehydrogenase